MCCRPFPLKTWRTCRDQARRIFWEGNLFFEIPVSPGFCHFVVWMRGALVFIVPFCDPLLQLLVCWLIELHCCNIVLSMNAVFMVATNLWFLQRLRQRERDDRPCPWVACVFPRPASADAANFVRVGEAGPGCQSDAESSIFQGALSPDARQLSFASQCKWHSTQVEYAHPGFTYDLVMRLVT